MVDVQSAVDLIGSIKTKTGLKLFVFDDAEYELAKKSVITILSLFLWLKFSLLNPGITKYYPNNCQVIF
ncbi:MAG: hypothetical protein LBI79_09700 [Nitrososphaerota archaeon]|nr:hypothetical protein [Nitrososphaerota archaeon]